MTVFKIRTLKIKVNKSKEFLSFYPVSHELNKKIEELYCSKTPFSLKLGYGDSYIFLLATITHVSIFCIVENTLLSF